MSDVGLKHHQHYSPQEIDAPIAAALSTLTANGTPLTLEVLASLDQFHTGGVQATRSLAERANLSKNDEILDIGGGLGGSARWLARGVGCRVMVIDLTEAYCRVGAMLTNRTGLSSQVRFQQGDALDLPLETASFDVVWTQHATMNIPDKARLYAQIHRVLRPGGRFVMHEVMAGTESPIHYPTMWAHDESTSFLMPPDAVRALIRASSFRECSWNDTTQWSLEWMQKRVAQQQSPQQQAVSGNANPLGLHLLLGPDTGLMLQNHVRNLEQQRIRIIEAVFERMV